MTVQTTASRADYTGNGSTTTFTVPFYFLDNTHIKVLRTQISTGVITTLALSTDYTVTGAGVGAGGSITCTTTPTTDQKISVLRNVPLTQLSHYVPNDPFPAATHEQIVDQLTMEVQQVNEVSARALQLPANIDSSTVSTSLPYPSASKFIAWNSTATGLQNVDATTLATVVSYGTARADLFSGTGSATNFVLSANPGNQANLDVSISGVSQRPGVDFTWTSGTAITFTSAPPAGTNNILVRYMQGLPLGTIDSASVTYLAAGTGATTRSGQDKLRDRVSVKDFGAVGDGVTDDYAAIMAAINSITYGTGYYISGPAVYFPPGTYYCSQTIQLKRSVKLYADGSGLPYASTATLKFAAGITGIVVHRYNTIDATVQGTPTTAGDASIIEGLQLTGAYGTADSMGGHGIWLRARAVLRNLSIGGFTGHGVQIFASAGGAASSEGNANDFVLDTITTSGNGEWGVFIDGADVNAGDARCIDASSNGSGGIWESSFLGNTHVAHHTQSNGIGTAGYNQTRGRTSTVSYGGTRYYAVYGATQASLVSTTPGTDSTKWDVIGAGGASTAYPLWSNTSPVGTYFVSNPYLTDGTNAKNVFVGCYSESGASVSYMVYPTLVLSGSLSTTGSRAHLTVTNQGPTFSNQSLNVGDLVLGSGSSSLTSGTGLTFTSTDSASYSWTLQKAVGRWGFKWANLSTPGFLMFYDRSATVANGYARDLNTSNGAIGLASYYFGVSSQMKLRTLGTAAPTSGDYLQGDIIWHSSPVASGYIGWTCVSASRTTTGSITSGTSALTVASGTGINNGDTITVAGAGVSGANLTTTVSSGGGTTSITLAATASTTVSGAAVTTPGTWKTFGAISA